jgi:DNA-binding MarR family transcriptional regulator
MITDTNGVQTPTEYCDIINQNDPYFEERGTNYIVHYLLASNKNYATAWWRLFNEHKGQTIYKAQFVEDLADFCNKNCGAGEQSAKRVLESEFNTLIRTYYGKDGIEDDPEETKICPLTELRLVTLSKQEGSEKTYKKSMPDKDDIHPLIAYAVISYKQAKLDMDEIQISELINGENNIGKIFNIDRSTVFYLIEKIERLGLIKITRTAGLDVIKVAKKMTLAERIKAYCKRRLTGSSQVRKRILARRKAFSTHSQCTSGSRKPMTSVKKKSERVCMKA